jgi:hypothetical protein
MYLCDYCHESITDGDNIATVNGFIPPIGETHADDILTKSTVISLHLHASTGQDCAQEWYTQISETKGKRPKGSK